ncbi:MAG: radical SAM protein [Clostridiales bacterium]|nr:radical SAM protein [Clostridiales bacterium]
MELSFPFDPLQRSEEAERLVTKEEKRLYHKFRAAPYYGGIATADSIGCSFLCAYCWSYGRNENPALFGRLYSPEQVADNLLRIARRRSFHLLRVTGSEPILGKVSLRHLLKVIEIVHGEEPRAKFILETNGLMLGHREDLAAQLKLDHLLVRIAIKGVDPVSFEKITGARAEFFSLPLKALQNLNRLSVRAWPALMADLFNETEIAALKRTLQESGIRAELELESLEVYPFVLENMRRRGLLTNS